MDMARSSGFMTHKCRNVNTNSLSFPHINSSTIQIRTIAENLFTVLVVGIYCEKFIRQGLVPIKRAVMIFATSQVFCESNKKFQKKSGIYKIGTQFQLLLFILHLFCQLSAFVESFTLLFEKKWKNFRRRRKTILRWIKLWKSKWVHFIFWKWIIFIEKELIPSTVLVMGLNEYNFFRMYISISKSLSMNDFSRKKLLIFMIPVENEFSWDHILEYFCLIL